MDDVKPGITFLRPSLDAAKHISSLGQLLPSSFGVIQNSYDILHVIAIAIALHTPAIAVAEQCPLETQTELLRGQQCIIFFFSVLWKNNVICRSSSHEQSQHNFIPNPPFTGSLNNFLSSENQCQVIGNKLENHHQPLKCSQ